MDRISDFWVDEDKIVLDRSIFTAVGLEGVLKSQAFVLGTEALDQDDRIIFDQESNSIYYDADGSGAAAKILFAQLSIGNTSLTNTDFVIIA